MMKPNISIGVCIKNCEDFIEDAIDSIVKQDYPHRLMEVIFVDDGSKDNTLSIIHKCVSQIDIPVKIFHTSWKGLGHARNIVVVNAEGDYILWVDGDMVLSKDFVRKLVKFIEKHPKIGIVKGKQALIPGKNFLATLEAYSRAVSRMVNYESEKARLKSLGTGGSIYRIEAIKQVGGFDENLKGYGEDYDIEIRVRKKGWVLSTTDVKFRDYERHELTWKKLWLRYFKRGYDQYSLMQKHKGAIDFFKMLPFITFIAGLFHSLKIYKITRNKIVFLLPLQYVFKTFAWYYGFIKANNNL